MHVLALQAQQAHAEGHPIEEVQALNSLSLALAGVATPVSTSLPPDPVYTSLPATSAASPTPLISEPTESQEATNLSPTPGGPFELQETRLICNTNQPSPLIQVDFNDAAGRPVPNIEVFITWEGGEDHFFTGLQPELGLGYGDYVMTPDIVYSVSLYKGGQVTSELTPTECNADDGSSYWGVWYLRFVQQ